MPEGVSGELIELLHYIEHTSETEAAGSSSPRIKDCTGGSARLKPVKRLE